MEIENRHHIVVCFISAFFTVAIGLITSIMSNISWNMVIGSSIVGAVYIGLLGLGFGWPIYILVRVILTR